MIERIAAESSCSSRALLGKNEGSGDTRALGHQPTTSHRESGASAQVEAATAACDRREMHGNQNREEEVKHAFPRPLSSLFSHRVTATTTTATTTALIFDFAVMSLCLSTRGAVSGSSGVK